MSDTLRLTEGDWRLIAREVLAAWPNEACGLLLGRRCGDAIVVTEVLPSPNVAQPEHSANRFEIDPQLLLRVHRERRGAQTGIVGHYHSHPNGRAELSVTDRAEGHTPDLVWLVVALEDGEITDRVAYFQTGTGSAAAFEPLAFGVLVRSSPDVA